MAFHVDGLERYEATNYFNYTETQQAEKQRWLKELSELYPDVSPLWREWVYDLCVNTPADELEEMKARIATSPAQPPKGGELHTGQVLNEDGTPV